MNIYVVKEFDSYNIYTFLNKKNAITFMYNKCKQWGVILSVFQNGNYFTLEQLYHTDEEKISFLVNCSQKILNDIFYHDWIYAETTPEDY